MRLMRARVAHRELNRIERETSIWQLALDSIWRSPSGRSVVTPVLGASRTTTTTQ